MKHACILLLCLFACSAALVAQEKIQTTIFFETDKHHLNAEAVASLEECIQAVKSLPEYSVEIHAHTDKRGSHQYNDMLAEKRAQAVYEYLSQYGIPAEKTISHSYGENKPVSVLDAEEGWQLNRRVELIVHPFLLKNIDDALSRISTCEEQIFIIDPNQHTALEGANGTMIWVEEMAFLNADGSPVTASEVQLVLREAYTSDVMITMGLSTYSDGRMLETGGMLSMEAYADGQPLQIQDGKSLTVALPSDFPVEGMELFRAQENEASGAMEWTPAGQTAKENLEYKLKLPPRPKMPALEFMMPKAKFHKLAYPDKPKPPRKPYPPIQPNRESIQYNPPVFKKLVMGKKKIEQKEEEIFQQKMKEYQEKMKRYHVAKEEYAAALEAYKDQVAAHERGIALMDEDRKKEIEDFYNSQEYTAAVEKEQKAQQKLQEHYQKKLAVWRAERQRLIEEYEAKYGLSGEQGRKLLNRYFFDVTDLGWINCDRFVRTPERELVRVEIADPDAVEERIFLVFEEINSIIAASKGEAGYYVNNMPKGKKVKIIGLKVADGRAQVAMHNTTIKEDLAYNLDYKPYRLAEVKELLANL